MSSEFPLAYLRPDYDKFCHAELKRRAKVGRRHAAKTRRGFFPLTVEDEFQNVTIAQVRYAMSDERWFLYEEFDIAADYLRESELLKHPFLDFSATLRLVPTMVPTSPFEMPGDQALNDFLMRLRPFLFEQDMFYWQHMLF
jgi:hypothetical protein